MLDYYSIKTKKLQPLRSEKITTFLYFNECELPLSLNHLNPRLHIISVLDDISSICGFQTIYVI